MVSCSSTWQNSNSGNLGTELHGKTEKIKVWAQNHMANRQFWKNGQWCQEASDCKAEKKGPPQCGRPK